MTNMSKFNIMIDKMTKDISLKELDYPPFLVRGVCVWGTPRVRSSQNADGRRCTHTLALWLASPLLSLFFFAFAPCQSNSFLQLCLISRVLCPLFLCFLIPASAWSFLFLFFFCDFFFCSFRSVELITSIHTPPHIRILKAQHISTHK